MKAIKAVLFALFVSILTVFLGGIFNISHWLDINAPGSWSALMAAIGSISAVTYFNGQKWFLRYLLSFIGAALVILFSTFPPLSLFLEWTVRNNILIVWKLFLVLVVALISSLDSKLRKILKLDDETEADEESL